MIQYEQNVTATPQFSIVISVYNDWMPLDQCLQSLSRQTGGPSFEVVIVDDGSTETTPEFICNSAYPYTITIVQQAHAGIPAARNLGIQTSRGEVVLFVDADCTLRTNCLAALSSTIARSPQNDCFQLRLVGNCSSLVGRAEELRLMVFQRHMLQPDGRIRYLNTAGFAIRRARANIETGLFDPAALRAEDTLLLANLMQVGEFPLFVPDAIVEHVIRLSPLECFRKDIRTACLEGRTYDIIASKGLRIRVTHRERVQLLWSMWRAAGQNSIGRSAWFMLVARQALQRMISFCYQSLRVGSPTHV